MAKTKNTHSSCGRGNAMLDTSLSLDDMELMPEEVAVLRMIHSTNSE